MHNDLRTQCTCTGFGSYKQTEKSEDKNNTNNI